MVSPVAMAGLSRRRLSDVNLLAAEKLPDNGHFEFERHRETGRLFTCLDHSGRELKNPKPVTLTQRFLIE